MRRFTRIGFVIAALALGFGLVSMQPHPAQAAGATLVLPSAACAGGANVTFSWTPVSGASQQWLDLSLLDNGFAPGTLISAGPLGSQESSLPWNGLQPGAVHYWRINSLTATGWVPSATGVFTPCGSPQLLWGPLTCRTDATAAVTIHWSPVADPGAAQWIDLTNNGSFAPSQFRTVGPLAAIADSYQWEGIQSGSTYSFRVNSLGSDGTWRTSGVGMFTSDCLRPFDKDTIKTAPPGLYYRVSQNLSDDDESLIRRTVDSSQDFASAAGGFNSATVAIFGFNDLDQVTNAMVQFYGYTPAEATRVRASWTNVAAVASYRSMFIYTNSPVWRMAPNPNQTPSQIVAHEYFHTVQLELLGREPEGLPDDGPLWLVEGGAEYFSWRVESSLTGRALSDIRSTVVMGATGLPGQLRQLEQGLPNYRYYQLSHLAVEYLVGDRGTAGLVNFYRLLGQNLPWATAFQQTFGKSPADFYTAFEAWRANGFK